MSRRVIAELGFWIAALVPVAAILIVPEVALQDGGLHLSSATALGHVLGGEFRNVIEWRPGIPPNATMEFALLGLLQVLDPGVALKVLVGLVLLGFAWAGRSLVVAAGAPGPWAALMLPFAWNRPLAMGFLGFSAGVVLAMVTVAVVLRRPNRPPVLGLAALLTITWYTHLVPALIALGVCILVVIAAELARRQIGSPAEPLLGLLRVTGASVPPLALTAVFVIMNPPGGTLSTNSSLLSRAKTVLGMTWPNVSTVQEEYWIYRVFALVLFVVTLLALTSRIRAGWRTQPADGLFLAAAAGAILSLLSPDAVSSGGSFLGMRLSLFLPLWIAAWIAVQLDWLQRREPRLRVPLFAIGLGAAALVVLLAGLRFPVQARFGRLIDEVREVGSCLPENSTVVQVGLDDGSTQVPALGPMQDQVGFVVAEREALDMGNLSGWVPYFLWTYSADQRPDELLSTERNGILLVPPRIDIARALAAGFRLDAVLVYGRPVADPSVLQDPATQKTLADLQSAYKLVAVSTEGSAELWLRHDVEASCADDNQPTAADLTRARKLQALAVLSPHGRTTPGRLLRTRTGRIAAPE